MCRAARKQQGLSLVELLVSAAIASTLIAPLVLALRSSVRAQAGAVAVNGVNQQARFALQRMAAKVRSTPAATALGAKAADTTGGWLAPTVYCLNGAGAVIETNTFDTLCAGSRVIASGVTAFSVQTFSAGGGAAPVIEIQLSLAGSQGAAVALTSRTRLGGGTL